jgi:hypothetical protein
MKNMKIALAPYIDQKVIARIQQEAGILVEEPTVENFVRVRMLLFFMI